MARDAFRIMFQKTRQTTHASIRVEKVLARRRRGERVRQGIRPPRPADNRKSAPAVCLFHASVSQGRICSHKLTCCHTEIEVADQTVYSTQSPHTDTGPTSPGADPISLGPWQGGHWNASFSITGVTRPGKITLQAGFEPRIFRSQSGRLDH